jgi:5-methylcytosine-specific restriction endonuclease McrA
MGKKLPYTPNSQIKSALRRLFLRSRERAQAIKRDEYTCTVCGAKKSVAKGREISVECHHKEGVCNWSEIYAVIRKHLLCGPEDLETLCKKCHQNETNKEKDDAG